MGKQFKKIADKFFKEPATGSGDGLFATLDTLMKMRKYAAYLKAGRFLKSYARDAGDLRSAFKGRGIEMEEIRTYQFGDDVRDIDWRVTARKDQPYTKVYQEERDHEIYVWLDLSPLMSFGSVKELKSVTAAKIAALLGWIALERQDKFGCVIFDGVSSWAFRPKRHRAYLSAILKKISEISKKTLEEDVLNPEEKLKSLRHLRLQAKDGASVFLISSFLDWGDDFETELAAFSKISELFAINVFDRLEVKAPPSGQYFAQYQGQKLVFDSSSKTFRKNYESYFQKILSKQQNFCRRFGYKFINFSAEMSFASGLKIF